MNARAARRNEGPVARPTAPLLVARSPRPGFPKMMAARVDAC